MTARRASAEATMTSGTIHPDLFRRAMTRFASGVTIVTTLDADGRRWGFTASAFTSLSLEPPLVLVCLDRRADSHPAFSSAPGYVINVLGREHELLARQFATKEIDKFAGDAFRPGLRDGLPVLDDALVSLKCRSHACHDGGDHTILIGQVEYAIVRDDGAPALYFDAAFWELGACRR
jgi:flavin reductase ActVB